MSDGFSVDIQSPLATTVFRVEVNIGDEIVKDADVMILVSASGEVSVKAPCDGEITEILCKEGDSLEQHQIIARMIENK